VRDSTQKSFLKRSDIISRKKTGLAQTFPVAGGYRYKTRQRMCDGPDLLALEREKSLVDSESLSVMLYGGKERLGKLREIWRKVENDPAFEKSNRPNLNHLERYNDACRKVRRFSEIVEETRNKAQRDLTLDEIYDLYLGVDENLPLDVHLSMFIPIMELHTDSDQRARWLAKSKSFQIIGAYAQTELAHGSNVRGLETTATYLPEHEAFDLHSPTLTSTKWWPGGLGKTCTHAVVYANLVISGKNYGPHPFMVQIRTGDHEPCLGIEVGDIGPKAGYNSMDNGYARFTHVRVPRGDMLRGFAQVSASGEYTQSPGAAKLAYGIMLDVRCRIVANSAYVLARALTIAIRYSCVRLQGSSPATKGNSPEMAVMEYPTQQKILIPLLSLAFALHFTGVVVRRQYDTYVETHNQRFLPDLHCTTASLKALVTAIVSDGMEAARKACGGHGFLQNAGFSEILLSYLPFCTLEGTREVLGQQGGRHLLKCLTATTSARTKEGKGSLLDPNTAYLTTNKLDQSEAQAQKQVQALEKLLKVWSKGTKEFEEEYVPQFSETEIILLLVSVCETRARYVVSLAAKAVAAATAAAVLVHTTKAVDVALLEAGVELVAASEAHAELLLVRGFADGLSRASLPVDTAIRLRTAFRLFVISLMEQHAADFIGAGLLSSTQLRQLSTCLRHGCRSLRPHGVALIEGWAFSDRRLGSTLGRSDGRYAEALYAAALQEPLNSDRQGWERHLRFVIGSDRPFARSRI